MSKYWNNPPLSYIRNKTECSNMHKTKPKKSKTEHTHIHKVTCMQYVAHAHMFACTHINTWTYACTLQTAHACMHMMCNTHAHTHKFICMHKHTVTQKPHPLHHLTFLPCPPHLYHPSSSPSPPTCTHTFTHTFQTEKEKSWIALSKGCWCTL